MRCATRPHTARPLLAHLELLSVVVEAAVEFLCFLRRQICAPAFGAHTGYLVTCSRAAVLPEAHTLHGEAALAATIWPAQS